MQEANTVGEVLDQMRSYDVVISAQLANRRGDGATGYDIVDLLNPGYVDVAVVLVLLAKPIGRRVVDGFDSPAAGLRDQRIETGTPLGLEYLADRDRVQRIRGQPVNCLGRQRHDFAGAQKRGDGLDDGWIRVVNVKRNYGHGETV